MCVVGINDRADDGGLAAIARENPLLKVAAEPAKHLVAFVGHPKSLLPLRALLKQSWAPNALAVGSRTAYPWCAAGVLESKLSRSFARSTADAVNTRNGATALEILAASKSAASAR